MVKKLSYELKKINKQLATEYCLIEEAMKNVKRVNELAILYIKSNKSYEMSDKQWSEFKNHRGESIIEFDEVMNNANMIANEYDITIDQVTGKVWLAGNAKESECIIQGIITGYISKDKDIPGAGFDYVDICDVHKKEKKTEVYKPARFTGSIFFEDLPVLVFTPPKKAEIKGEESQIEDAKYSEVENDDNIDIKIPNFETLRLIKKGQLKPPRGLSRTTRKRWNIALRKKYPVAFDESGNFIGFNIPDEVSKELDISTLRGKYPDAFNNDGDFVGFKPSDKVPNHEVVKHDNVVMEPGKGNLITTTLDARMSGKFFIGKLYEGRGYAVVSTYSKDGRFEDAAWIICNKERTAQFVLDGLHACPGFAKLVKDNEVFSVKVLKKSYFNSESVPVYFITDAVGALKALGTAEEDIDIIKHRVN